MTNALILLVSDNPLTRRMVRSTLSAKGYALIEADSPRSALAQLDNATPALILQDLVLADAEQFRLTASLRERLGEAVPILAFVGLRSELYDARLASAGFNDTITKPIDATRLLQTVEGHLPERSAQIDRFGAGRRLILADDDPLQLKLMRFRLERYGFDVATASDGASALLLAEQSPPDAIVADIMMPVMDGFGLALAVRQSAQLEHLPLILITASYVEESDRELARRAGATELVLHTPDLIGLIDTLRRALSQPMAAPRIGPERRVQVEHEHERRVVRQLERQVLLNAGLSRRCSALAAELRVLAGISENVLKHRELDPAIDEALIACLDACGIARGVLYLLSGENRIKVRAIGAEPAWTLEQLRDFFGHERTLRELIAAATSTFLSTDAGADREHQQLLAACGVSSMLIVPLIYLDRPFGALMLAEPSQSQNADDLIAFAEGLAGQITQVLALAAAFAEESRARDRAEEQAALCNALLLHAPDCIAHLDPRGTILFANHVLLESQPEMQVGRDWLSAQPLEFREIARDSFDIVISTGEPTSFETTTTDAAGGDGSVAPRPRWYSHRLGPVRREGQIIGVMLVARDISDKKMAEAQLLVSDRMASVGMLAASVAHEINNPLAAMMINLELMERDLVQREPNGDRLQRELEGAREGGRRVIQVVRDLKIFSRSSETLTRVKPRDVLECSIRMANNEIRHRARLALEFGDVPTVDADESRLGQVFLNLIMNAVQSMPEGNAEMHELRIALALDDLGRVLVSISDTGCGIPAEDQAQLFRPFFTTKPLGVGTGLGLSICQRIVESMGGAIGFDSRAGQGSRFWVALPPSKRASLPSVRPTAVPNSTRRGKILIVEDDRLVADMIRRFLSREHDVRIVTRASDALRLIGCEPCFDVILCDLMMPQMTGQELFTALSEIDPRQAKRMVFMTGGPFTKTAREFLGSIANRRIDKPFDLQDLRRLMNELVAA